MDRKSFYLMCVFLLMFFIGISLFIMSTPAIHGADDDQSVQGTFKWIDAPTDDHIITFPEDFEINWPIKSGIVTIRYVQCDNVDYPQLIFKKGIESAWLVAKEKEDIQIIFKDVHGVEWQACWIMANHQCN